MPAEQLNIKIKFDISDLTAGVKKAKTKLGEVATAAKRNIPHINTESKKASKSLVDVSEAGSKVKKTLDSIGSKAKSSLSSLTTESGKITSAFQKMGLAGRAASTGINVDGTTTSLDEMKDTMENIARIDLFGALAAQSHRFTNVFKGVKNAVIQVKESLALLKIQSQKVLEHWEDYKADLNFGMDTDVAKARLELINNEFRKLDKERKKVFKNLLLSIKAVGLELMKLVKTLAMVGAAFTAFVLPINAFSISKMAHEIDVAAQRVGFSAQAYQEWTYVLNRAGIEASELVEVMKTLTEAQIDVIKGEKEFVAAFEMLGMTQEQVASMSQEQLWNATITALQNMEDATMRNVVAQRIFEEDMSKLTPLLNMTNQQTQSLISTYNALGATMSADLIKKSNQLQAAVVNLRAAWQGLRNTLAQAVIPAVITVVNVLTKAIIIVNTFLQVIFGFDLTPALNNMNAGFSGGSGAADDYADSVGGAASALEKLRRATMGFDELNKLPSQDTGSGGGSSGSGGGSFGGGGGISIPTNSVFDEATNDLVAFREKVMAFMEKWKTQLQVIAGALGGLTIAGLLGSFGNLIGLGDNFLGIIQSIKQTAGAVITITLQYMAVNEFLDNYLDGEGFKNWIYAALSTALGSLILWSMWGATGLAIGLGITAYVSLDAIFEEGGITNIESGVVALTGVATAIAAISFAWKGLGISAILGNIGAFISLLWEGNKITAVLAAAFPKLAGVVASIGTAFGSITGYITGAFKAVSSFIGSLISGTTLATVGIIAAIASAAYFLYENWEKVSNAVKRFFELAIVPKLEQIKQKWEEIKAALATMGDAFMNAIPEGARQLLINVGNWLANLVKQVKDFIEQSTLLGIVADIFEWVGAAIFSVVGGVIAVAISTLTTLIMGVVSVITGAVEVISGVVSTCVNVVVGLITGDFAAAKESVQLIWDGIVNIFRGAVEMTVGVVAGFVQSILDWFISLWDELVGHSIVPDMINAIVEWFAGMPAKVFAAVAEFVSGVITRVKGLWTDITTWFKSNVAPKFEKSYWMTKFDTIRQAANEKLEAAKQLFTSIWSSITSWFSANVSPKFTASYWAGKFESIKSGAKTVLNSLIGVIEKAANSIVGKVNSISFRAPDWVPKYGGKTIGFSLKTISIPRLANGGITTGSTIANIGEKGTEMVLPLTGTQGSAWMDMLADKIASRNQSPSKIVLSVDGRELGWAAINNINGITEQTGGLQLVL